MWNRSDLKQRAKAVLKQGYWLAFVVCLIWTGVTGGVNSFATGRASSADTSGSGGSGGAMIDDSEVLMLIGIILLVTIVVVFFVAAFSVFVSSPLQVGKNRFFMDMRAGRQEFSNIIFGFTAGYGNIIKTMFLMNLKIVLWSLLLFIPGIIKSYEYFFVPYILSENPAISSKRAFEISKRMTDDDKLNIWVMQLSFIGWMLLGALACGIGIAFVNPYYEASFAELYAAMRDKAFYNGYATQEELIGFGQPYQKRLPQ